MPGKFEALNSQKLTPCVTLIIFSFMVSFTMSILVLALNVSVLQIPVLAMWGGTVFFVLLTAIYWYCQRVPFKNLRTQSCSGFGRHTSNSERRSLSPLKDNASRFDRDKVSYGGGGNTEITITGELFNGRD